MQELVVSALLVVVLASAGCSLLFDPGPGQQQIADATTSNGDATEIDAPQSDAVASMMLDVQVAASADDSFESPYGNHPTSQWCSLYSSAHWAGTRFQVGVPRGATILDAWVTVYVSADLHPEDNPDTMIYAEASDDASNFTAEAGDISVRPRSSAVVHWKAESIGSQWQRTPSLKDVVQEIVDRDGWDHNQHIAFIWHHQDDTVDGGDLEFRQIDFAGFAARLHLEYRP